MFLYYNLRDPYENLRGKYNGSYLRDGFKVVNKLGIPDEKFCDFIVQKVKNYIINFKEHTAEILFYLGFFQ